MAGVRRRRFVHDQLFAYPGIRPRRAGLIIESSRRQLRSGLVGSFEVRHDCAQQALSVAVIEARPVKELDGKQDRSKGDQVGDEPDPQLRRKQERIR